VTIRRRGEPTAIRQHMINTRRNPFTRENVNFADRGRMRVARIKRAMTGKRSRNNNGIVGVESKRTRLNGGKKTRKNYRLGRK
jgi:hypothetical protein